MRVRFLGLWLPLVCACSATNVVSGPEQTEAERIEAAAPEWCAKLCDTTRKCVQSDCECVDDACECRIEDKCESNCESVLTEMALTSDDCAKLAERLLRCYQSQGCAALGEDQPCGAIEEQAQSCYVSDDQGGVAKPTLGSEGVQRE